MDITKHQDALNRRTKEQTSAQLAIARQEKREQQKRTDALRRQVRRMTVSTISLLSKQYDTHFVPVTVRCDGVSIQMAAYPTTKSWHENIHSEQFNPYWSTLVSIEGAVIKTPICRCYETVTEELYRNHIDPDYQIVSIDELGEQQLRDIVNALSKLERALPKLPRLYRRIASYFLNR